MQFSLFPLSLSLSLSLLLSLSLSLFLSLSLTHTQQKAENYHQASMLYPQLVDEIDHLDNQIKGGTTVVLALIYNNYLYVANVGDSRALLCSYVSWSTVFSMCLSN